MKESIEIGRDWDPTWKNKWPKEADSPGFKHTMLQFFQVSRRTFQTSTALYNFERYAMICM